jgi:Hg(II)-responsive transcriptional regulator
MWMSEAASQAGVNVQTIRYYERRGLLPSPRRRPSGYRDFQADTVRRVRFIKRAQDLGFSLDEIAELLQLRAARPRNRTRIRLIAERRVQQIEQKIADLEAMRTVLRELVHRCQAGTTPECPIIEAFEEPQERRS